MEIIELETAIQIAMQYIYSVGSGENVEEATKEMANEMREKKYDAESEDEEWQYDDITDEQLQLIRYMIYHDFQNLTKGDANRIIRIMKQTMEEE